MDGVHLPQGYRATTTRSLLFTTKSPQIPGTHFDQPRKEERLSRPWIHLVVLNTVQPKKLEF